MILLTNPVEIAWCAGLFEGEGSVFQVNQIRSNGKNYQYLRAVLKMTDLDIVEKFHKLVGCGTLHHQTDKCKSEQPGHWKRHYTWQLTKREDLEELMILFWEHLGERRRAKILELKLLEHTVYSNPELIIE